MSVLDEIKALEEKKTKLLAAAKQEAIAAANAAIKTLNELGFNYSLVEGSTSTTASGGGKRRTGIRNDVLKAIQAAPNGISRADLLEQLGAKGDTSFEQSVSNAVSNLKKAGKITGDDGTYKAA